MVMVIIIAARNAPPVFIKDIFLKEISMIELNASISTYSQKQVSIESQSQRQFLSVAKNHGGDKKPDLLNATNQDNQIIDDLDISAAAIKKLNEAKALSEQIQNYLDYLNGETPQNIVLTTPSNDNDNSNIQINAQSVETSTSISYSETTATQTDINARFTDDGELIDLEINQIRVSEKSLFIESQNRILDLSISA